MEQSWRPETQLLHWPSFRHSFPRGRAYDLIIYPASAFRFQLVFELTHKQNSFLQLLKFPEIKKTSQGRTTSSKTLLIFYFDCGNIILISLTPANSRHTYVLIPILSGMHTIICSLGILIFHRDRRFRAQNSSAQDLQEELYAVIPNLIY